LGFIKIKVPNVNYTTTIKIKPSRLSGFLNIRFLVQGDGTKNWNERIGNREWRKLG
jgi:hypothetical protein